MPGAICNYRPATESELQRVRQLERVCAEFDVSLAAASLQFSLAHPTTAAIIVGVGNSAEAEQTAAWVDAPIPAEFWAKLRTEGLVDERAPLPGST